jgi:hypothetical protein
MPKNDTTGRTNRPRTTDTDTDASAGWREEYAAQGVADAIATDDGERPEDCICWNADHDLACWPCYRAGFDTQNPAEPAADDSDHAEEPDEPASLETVADGGTTDALPAPGDRVRDRDTADGDELVVISIHPDTEARDWWIAAIDATVAEVNPAYDDGAPVVEAVYAAEAEDRLDGWREVEDLRDAVAFGALNVYSFPADRLAAVDEAPDGVEGFR